MRGVELGPVFHDEDRTCASMDYIYDKMRVPMFGRTGDIETMYIFYGDGGDGEDTIHFPGTSAGESVWNSPAPLHVTETIKLSDFEQHPETGNSQKDMAVVVPSPNRTGKGEDNGVYTYDIVQGSREEFDRRFNGCCSSLNATMNDEIRKKLGKRIPDNVTAL